MLHLPAHLLAAGHTEENWRQVFELLKPRCASGHLGIELVSVAEDSIVLGLTISDAVRQPYGLLHGGVSMLLAEEASSMHATWGVDLRQRVPVGMEINGSHLRSAREGRVEARARVLRRGVHSIVHHVDIVHLESDDLLCVARVTNLYRDTSDLMALLER